MDFNRLCHIPPCLTPLGYIMTYLSVVIALFLEPVLYQNSFHAFEQGRSNLFLSLLGLFFSSEINCMSQWHILEKPVSGLYKTYMNILYDCVFCIIVPISIGQLLILKSHWLHKIQLYFWGPGGCGWWGRGALFCSMLPFRQDSFHPMVSSSIRLALLP